MGMIDDDLNKPLGQFPTRKLRLLGNASNSKTALTALSLLGVLGFLAGVGGFSPGSGGQPPVDLNPGTGVAADRLALAPRKTLPFDGSAATATTDLAFRPAAVRSGEAIAPLPFGTPEPVLGHAEMLEQQSGVENHSSGRRQRAWRPHHRCGQGPE